MDRRDFLSALAAAPLLSHPSLVDLVRGASRAGTPADMGLQTGVDEAYALVLGTVQDAGFPQVGCYTDRCDQGRALHSRGQGRFVSSLAVVQPAAERFYLVDATPDITRQLDLIALAPFRRRAAQRRPFDGIFLTHAHIGHYLGLALLGNEGLGIRDTPVYCTEAMVDFLSSNQPWQYLAQQGRIVWHPLALDHWHRIDEHLEVQLWKVPHRDEFADTVGFVFRGPSASLLFLPDINSWGAWDRNVSHAVASVDVALLDASFWSLEELPGRSMDDLPHPLIPQTMDALQAVVDRGDARVILTHLNNSNPALDDNGPERREITRRGFEVAREGMRIPL
ncbi:MAG: MBL fold metallo-hydrolase [Gemmatimonadales bacterium]|jgi:pyrroloquinoline quinone biosynthesis protein B|nr:MAG: MBL fold metallo-hydrolase [Gemmatimonadales bacterium]